jgi:hypothetical protein
MTRDELIQYLLGLYPDGTTEVPLIRRGHRLLLGQALYTLPGTSRPFYRHNPDERLQCTDCGTWEGGLHLLGCDIERCGLCGGQYTTCACERPPDTPRVPYMDWPNVCARCGEIHPALFLVPNEEWHHYIEMRARREVVCQPCYERVQEWLDTGPQQPPPTHFLR